MQPQESRILLIIILGTLMLALSSAFIILFILHFRHKQRMNLREKEVIKTQYEQELLQSQIEVQNQTLQYIGGEIHDNIGQLLSVVRLNINVLEEASLPVPYQRYATVASNLLEKAISELRSLSKSLNSDFIRDFGLKESLIFELERIESTGRLKTFFHEEGDSFSFGPEAEIILFRICQEVINNAIKHAAANQIQVSVLYDTDALRIRITDDGTGFDQEIIQDNSLRQSGSGLRNIRRKIGLLGGDCTIHSAVGKGTTFEIWLRPDPSLITAPAHTPR